MANYLITGKAYYAKIVGKPVPKYEPADGNEWAFDLAVDDNGIDQLKKLGLADKIKNKNDERGSFIQFRRGEYKGDKVTANEAIPIVDHRNQPWDNKTLIGNGSVLNVRFSVYPGRKGNKAFVTAVQVWDHKTYIPKAPFRAKDETAVVEVPVAEPFNDSPFVPDTEDQVA